MGAYNYLCICVNQIKYSLWRFLNDKNVKLRYFKTLACSVESNPILFFATELCNDYKSFFLIHHCSLMSWTVAFDISNLELFWVQWLKFIKGIWKKSICDHWTNHLKVLTKAQAIFYLVCAIT